jgi:hypothetical protein
VAVGGQLRCVAQWKVSRIRKLRGAGQVDASDLGSRDRLVARAGKARSGRRHGHLPWALKCCIATAPGIALSFT